MTPAEIQGRALVTATERTCAPDALPWPVLLRGTYPRHRTMPTPWIVLAGWAALATALLWIAEGAVLAVAQRAIDALRGA